MISAVEALQRLREGNLRFLSNERQSDTYLSQARIAELSKAQSPIAIILG